MARHNFFNGFHENSGFLGIGKGDFDGNSRIFANLLMSSTSLISLNLSCRLKELDFEAISASLGDCNSQI